MRQRRDGISHRNHNAGAPVLIGDDLGIDVERLGEIGAHARGGGTGTLLGELSVDYLGLKYLHVHDAAVIDWQVPPDPTANDAASYAARDSSLSHRWELNAWTRRGDLNNLGGCANRQRCGEHGTVARLKSEFLLSDLEPSHGHLNYVITGRYARQAELPVGIGPRDARLSGGDMARLDAGSRHHSARGVANSSHDLRQTIERSTIVFDVNVNRGRLRTRRANHPFALK